jgi:hypothetical protein
VLKYIIWSYTCLRVKIGVATASTRSTTQPQNLHPVCFGHRPQRLKRSQVSVHRPVAFQPAVHTLQLPSPSLYPVYKNSRPPRLRLFVPSAPLRLASPSLSINLEVRLAYDTQHVSALAAGFSASSTPRRLPWLDLSGGFETQASGALPVHL